MLHLHNTLTRQRDDFTPLNPEQVTIYSCGPTVYDHVHIGNLSAFIAADTLRRTISVLGHNVKHVMNFTDVDDKTIKRSREKYPDLAPMDALKRLTTEYGAIFINDMNKIGNDTGALHFIKAADDSTIQGMRELIIDLLHEGFAYIADDGIYFSIEAYKKSGKKYGQLVELDDSNTGSERIQNDEYDKESVHDFALWKKQKPGEPSWDFMIDDKDLSGRPGWHLECSVMSKMGLGQPFDIHTGGIDLAFPHHENEIAQSTAGKSDPTYAQVFVHNEHILVDGRKMSKSLQNFYTLSDLEAKGVHPLAFRLLVLQSHYRKQTNFSLDNAEAAHRRLTHWRNIAALRHQIPQEISAEEQVDTYSTTIEGILDAFNDDMNTPEALRVIDETFSVIGSKQINELDSKALTALIELIDKLLGLQLLQSTPDITPDQKQLIIAREQARSNKDWMKSDELRDKLIVDGITVRDTAQGTIWEYI
jgi:cysteinyl-tRNA synthetase